MDLIDFKILNKVKDHNVIFQYQYDECYNCLPQNVSLKSENNATLKLYNYLSIHWKFILNGTILGTNCSSKLSLLPNSSYECSIQRRRMTNVSKYNCLLVEENNADDYILPFYVMIVLVCFCGALYYTVLMLYRHRFFQKLGSKLFSYKFDLIADFGRPGSISNIPTDDEYDDVASMTMKLSSERRLRSLDSFRGLIVMLMIFVNYGGGGYWFFKHSTWNGLTIADLVFPWFVFVMGVTLSINMFRSMKRQNNRFYWLILWLKGCKRSVILFIIGVALGSQKCNGDLNLLRIMGPLQRLGGTYFCLITVICLVSSIQNKFKKNKSLLNEHESLFSLSDINSNEYQSFFVKVRGIFTDVWICLPFILLSFVLLLSHACISLLLSVPDCPVGYLGPGGIGDWGCCRNCSGGVAGYIDRLLLTPKHLYQNSTNNILYQTNQPYDPEGILGYLSSCALCFLGYWAGNVILLNNEWSRVVKRLVAYALLCAAIGTGLCEGQLNGGLIPINKNLWSVSFVLVATGTAFFLMAIMFATIDVLKLWNGSPFRYPGMNSILIYVGHILFNNTFLIHWEVNSGFTYKVMMDTWGVIFWTIVSYVMFQKKLLITV